MNLSDLVGEHILDTAAVMGLENRHDSEGIVDYIAFGMDNKTYKFYENPDDGYRSYLGDIEVKDGITSDLKLASLIVRYVMIEYHSTDEDGYACEMITVTDQETGHLWMRIGTRNTDDYYPCCVFE